MRSIIVGCCFLASLLAVVVVAAPTVPTDVEQPGTQPTEVPAYTPPSNCDNCHADTPNPDVEPFFGWQGSMMSHASRDPLFWSALAIAEQDFLPNANPGLRGGVGDLCLRCHMPGGWLGGRSTPTDGRNMDPATDADGVECEHCHLMVDPDPPVNVPGTIEEQTAPYIANDGSEAFRGSGMYVINSEGSRLGPFNDPVTPHAWKQSEFHRSSEMCATCHDVSNPVVGDLAHNFGAQVPLTPGTYSGVPGDPVSGKAAFNNPTYKYGIVERTYSEWKASAFSSMLVNDFPSLPSDLQQAGKSLDVAFHRAYDARSDANYEDGTPRYFTCQTCHMSAATGKGCKQNGAPTRTDLPRHDLTGSGYWVPELIQYQDAQGTLRFGSGLTATQISAMNAGMARAEAMLESAASIGLSQNASDLEIRVTNLTGHKLITGYPEGRRMWLHVRWLDAGDALVSENGAYGPIGRTVTDLNSVTHQVESIIDPAGTVVYEAQPGIDQAWAGQLLGIGVPGATALAYDRMTDAVTETMASLAAQPAGTMKKTFHFALNNVLLSDNRIPPYGLDYDESQVRNALPVPDTQFGDPGPGGTYDHWSDSTFAIPSGAVKAEVRLLYQQTSWEYVQFLWLNNDGQSTFLGQEGVNLLDGWANTDMSPPFEMASAVLDLTPATSAPGEASRPLIPAEQMRASHNGTTGEIDVQFTPACDASDHTIYYGPLGSVGTYGYTGAACAVGVAGTASFDPGPGNVFFLTVGNTGAVEGAYGADSTGAPRPEDTATAGCDLPQDLSGTCDGP